MSKGRREKVRQRRGPSRENSRGIVRDITTGYGAGGREGGWVGGWASGRDKRGLKVDEDPGDIGTPVKRNQNSN